jgi:hypothetical protein
MFRANDLKGTVSYDPTDGSYCSQPWDKQRPDEGNGQWYLEDTVPLMHDDDTTDVPLVNKTLHGIDHVSTRYMQLFTESSWGLWIDLCHNDAPLSTAARSLDLFSNISYV